MTFGDADEVIPGVRAVNLAGHSPGHTGYLFGEGEETVLFWGDTVHCHSVQLRNPSVATGTDSDAAAAVGAPTSAAGCTATVSSAEVCHAHRTASTDSRHC